MINNIYSFLFAQKRIKKGSRSLGPAMRDCPVLLAMNGRHRKVAPLGVLRRVAYPLFAALLGGVKWH